MSVTPCVGFPLVPAGDFSLLSRPGDASWRDDCRLHQAGLKDIAIIKVAGNIPPKEPRWLWGTGEGFLENWTRFVDDRPAELQRQGRRYSVEGFVWYQGIDDGLKPGRRRLRSRRRIPMRPGSMWMIRRTCASTISPLRGMPTWVWLDVCKLRTEADPGLQAGTCLASSSCPCPHLQTCLCLCLCLPPYLCRSSSGRVDPEPGGGEWMEKRDGRQRQRTGKFQGEGRGKDKE